MTEKQAPSAETSASTKLIVPALGISRHAPRGAMIIVSTLYLRQIGKDFDTPENLIVPLISQLNTIYSIIAMVTALIMGILTVRYRQQTLLMFGLFISFISAIGCFLAPSLSFLFLLYAIGGIGWSLIFAMTVALIGGLLPLDKRTTALAWIFAIPPIFTIIGAPFIDYIDNWRLSLLLFPIPISLTAIILSRISLPNIKTRGERTDLMGGFKAIKSNRSAASCVLAKLLATATFTLIMILSPAFLEEQHTISSSGCIYSGFALLFFLGALVGGWVVNKVGRKPSSVGFLIGMGIATILFIRIPSFPLAVIFGLVTSLFAGMNMTALSSLTLEQLPEFRGPLMSVNEALANLGSALCTGLGSGVLLFLYGWDVMGTIVGGLGVLAGLIVYTFVTDPTTMNFNRT